MLNLNLQIIVLPLDNSFDTDYFINQQLSAATRIYSRLGIQLISPLPYFLHADSLTLALTDLNINRCGSTPLPGGEIDNLSNYRNGLLSNVIAVFICRSLFYANNNPEYGCATHHINKPMVSIGSNAPEFTLAHELGHVLGILSSHGNDGDRVMSYVNSISSNNPKFLPVEINIIQNSNLLV